MLKIIEHKIKSVSFGEHTAYANGILQLNKTELIEAILGNLSGDYSLDVQLAFPGESKRIIHVTDVIKPAFKIDGAAFPGWMEDKGKSGEGVRHEASNLCITQSFQYPGIQEGMIDLSGQGAKYSIFSQKINLVVSIMAMEKTKTKAEIARDLIQMNVNAAVYIGKQLIKEEGQSVIFEESKENLSLPKIGYAYFIQAQGPLRNVHLMGRDCTAMKPEFMERDLILDGAVVSGNYIIACQKNPTYLHQENPVIRALLKEEGKSLRFGGVILSTESSSLEKKKENAQWIAQIAQEKGFDGIIITQEGGGHADVDLMTSCEACEERGIKTVLIANELGGPLGDLPALVDFCDKADAMVSTGNNDEIVQLPAMESVLGTPPLVQNKNACGQLELALGMLYTATCQLGVNKMKTQLY